MIINIMQLVLLIFWTAYLFSNLYFFSIWATLLELHQQLKTLLAQLEPLLDLVDILVEIHYW